MKPPKLRPLRLGFGPGGKLILLQKETKITRKQRKRAKERVREGECSCTGLWAVSENCPRQRHLMALVTARHVLYTSLGTHTHKHRHWIMRPKTGPWQRGRVKKTPQSFDLHDVNTRFTMTSTNGLHLISFWAFRFDPHRPVADRLLPFRNGFNLNTACCRP